MRRPLRKTLLALGLLGALAGLCAGAAALWRTRYRPGRFVTVADGVLYRSRQPCGTQWRVLKRRGIRTVVNLRSPLSDPEAFRLEQEACRRAGARFVSIPVGLVPSSKQVRRFLRTVRAGPPVLVHCEHGRSRAGQMSGAYRIIEQGWSAEEAFAEWERLGGSRDQRYEPTRELFRKVQRLRPAWRQLLAGPEPPTTRRRPPPSRPTQPATR